MTTVPDTQLPCHWEHSEKPTLNALSLICLICLEDQNQDMPPNDCTTEKLKLNFHNALIFSFNMTIRHMLHSNNCMKAHLQAFSHTSLH